MVLASLRNLTRLEAQSHPVTRQASLYEAVTKPLDTGAKPDLHPDPLADSIRAVLSIES